MFHDICRYPKWQIDGIAISTTSATVSGWALPFRGDIDAGEILLNSNKSPNFTWLQSPDIHSIFPYIKDSERCRFSATFALINSPAILHLSYAGVCTHDPYSKWTDIYFPLTIWSRAEFFTPESNGMKRTQGHELIFRYITYGFTVATQLDGALQAYFGKNLSNFRIICDWGVGCGRIAQMVHYLAPKSEIIGIDIDSENVNWCANTLPFGKYESISLYPPTNIGAETIDLIYGISVVTHLKRDALEAWISELSRILRPGGVALVTINGGAGLVGALSNNVSLVERVIQNGFDDGTRDGALDAVIEDKDYYRLTFMMHSTALELFSKKFRVRDILRQANAASQDLVVCERL
jgi:SAM-dependent methyltransferase